MPFVRAPNFLATGIFRARESSRDDIPSFMNFLATSIFRACGSSRDDIPSFIQVIPLTIAPKLTRALHTFRLFHTALFSRLPVVFRRLLATVFTSRLSDRLRPAAAHNVTVGPTIRTKEHGRQPTSVQQTTQQQNTIERVVLNGTRREERFTLHRIARRNNTLH